MRVIIRKASEKNMKLSVRHRIIDTIPTLEVVPKEHLNEPLPIVIFYHGWQTGKELVLTQARKIADKNFRVILPDAMFHGERNKWPLSKIPTLTFWTSIQYNLAEFETIIRYYQKRQLIQDDKIIVGGYSMGGITTAALMTQYPEIKVGASIMGTPQPRRYFDYMVKKITEMNRSFPTDLPLLMNWVNEFDLSLAPEKIANRPLYIWHGTEDKKIPYNEPFDFYKDIKEKSFAQNVVFKTGVSEGHLVTTELMEEIASFIHQSI